MMTSLSTVTLGKHRELETTVSSVSRTQSVVKEEGQIPKETPALTEQKTVASAVSGPASHKVPENQKRNNEDEPQQPKPVSRAQTTLKTPVPTSVLSYQAHSAKKTSAEIKKPEPPKPVMIDDLMVRQWPKTPKVKTVFLGMPEVKVLTLREENDDVAAEYDLISENIKNYCQDKKSCGYKPM